MKKLLIPAIASIALSGCGFPGYATVKASSDPTQAQAVAALSKLHFMSGTWTCVVYANGSANGYVSKLTYSFTPDGLFMIESEHSATSKYPRVWSLQMWGYDVLHKSFDAYQFTPAGVFTKTVQGWRNGAFLSTRDDNQYTVSIRKHSNRAFDWFIQPPDKSSTVTEACTR